ncbi:hypothetical protein [Candidatus Kuenenia stuttgartiensis]
MGYSCTIFESNPHPGGMLAHGRPHISSAKECH